MKFVGSKYSRDMGITDIAKAVRADIKAAQKKGTLPAVKVSVRARRYSGGRNMDRSLDIGIVGEDSAEMTACVEAIQAIADAYNDTTGDYFRVNWVG